MACWWRHCFCMMLAVIQTPTDAYISVNLALYCFPEGPPKVLHLQSKGPHSAVLVDLNAMSPYTPTTDRRTGAARCRLEVMAPPGHELAVHLDHPKVHASRTSEKRQGFLPCFLKLSHTRKASEYADALHKVDFRTVDLCNGSDITTDTLFITNHTNHLTLVWSPPDSSLAVKMVSKRLIITAFGTGMGECNMRHHFFCLGSRVHFPVCISSELACDGYNNCPFAGDDENPEDCGPITLNGRLFSTDPDSSEEGHRSDAHHVIETILKKAVLKTWTEVSSRKRDVTSTTTSKPVQNILSGLEISSNLLRNMSDIILKKFLNKNHNVHVAEPMNTTKTTTIKPPWQDNSEDPTFPAVLAQYGPWGYLMLGMLICGAILMLCGLWECCCRSSKHRLPAGGPTSTSAATTVFIISSAGRMGHHRRNSTPHQEETPPTPGPPSYEELDQPPSYSSLFPVTKASNMEPLTLQENHMISGQQI